MKSKLKRSAVWARPIDNRFGAEEWKLKVTYVGKAPLPREPTGQTLPKKRFEIELQLSIRDMRTEDQNK